ncbi:DedA family protein [Microbacterium indicum]|uniref:DedA family protein n=1 Tax=Microbacterium indicum TaxID=358100 RepID=UPI00056729F0|nr:DedA family protein [Microbacterium indicum]
MAVLTAAILALAASPWIYLIALASTALDAFFPPLPSETLVVALAAIGAASGTPNIWLLGLAMAVGAFIGDNLTYVIGRAVGTDRYRWMRGARFQRAVGWASGVLERRGGVMILVSRYIPIGRIAVNLSAGATGFPRRKFVIMSGLAAVAWAAYSVAIGALAGQWFHSNPILGAVFGVLIATAMGLAIDRISSKLRRRDVSRGSEPRGRSAEAHRAS